MFQKDEVHLYQHQQPANLLHKVVWMLFEFLLETLNEYIGTISNFKD
jgi:hypothetical protein